MSHLDQLDILDLTTAIDRIPRMPGHQVLTPRSHEQWITCHYSAVIYRDRSKAAELQRILDEAGYQIRKNWAKRGRPPIYGDGLMYDFVVLSEDGTIVRTRKRRQDLWHCNNATGNTSSWSIHWMLGPGQDLTAPQRESTFLLIDALRNDGAIQRNHVVAHCEWPLSDGLPVRLSTYQVRPGQSLCPGPVLFQHVAAYRAGMDAPREWQMRVVDPCSSDPDDNFAAVRTTRSRTASPARINGEEVRLVPGTLVVVNDLSDDYYHLAPSNPAGGAIGFIHKSLLEDA
jgi:N-acetylmuramoyl-L-alanine amidase-like protein